MRTPLVIRFLALHGRRGWIAIGLLLTLALVVVPVLNLVVPPESSFHIPTYTVTLIGRFICLAIVALAIDLIWGYTGVLSLGQGAFFALGGYVMGMHLTRASLAEGQLPNFMAYMGLTEYPWFWFGFESFWYTVLMILLVPGVLAFVFGFLAFRSRVRGVYFAIITQALTFALMLLFFRGETGLGGDTGLTGFQNLLGFDVRDAGTRMALYSASVIALALSYLLCRFVVTSKLGRVLIAVRDAETRLRFTGYDPLTYKLFVWTLSAVLCGIAGALYVPQTGVINPSEMAPAQSIEMVVWVALGGRGTLIGPLIGSGAVNVMKSWVTQNYPDLWLFFLGAIFVLVPLLMPRGIVGLFDRVKRRKAA
ncbi:urea ABC transporter permease subunit UrtC [Alkalilimnicola ehrlichii]|uniref:Urea ABC transporter permease subunit UrtC n=1 Tax=Alkalilimnicola ehrlichii TaxID=351052 RepID=A0A3E0WKI8_9GAMM|nr:urea ABC transporter permease subunit UrtC [Alkalilimnicola ehrlichii]RFA26411.1 urea ABC transporter permease subunit UrtC [Alkalilimnicola ehrlichii]RFA33474.1 urea ABC transporter permease subunit UrtC [Alkalilimnicola ehrlichii]